MPEKNLYDYAVIRVVPRVEREEFINVGVILFCKVERFLQLRYTLDPIRLRALDPNIDMVALEENLKAIDRICAGDSRGGEIAGLDVASRFRWLTATRSTVIQSSKVHPGYTEHSSDTLEKLFDGLVL
ncbi:DUF3037 domain-containing protein [uncultured Cytophaga sp.]|uniref:DUF3037 domain-containing protein n=1 Tax=uncultured Cytophaga sp. TaxID=160238 RepID=UPI0026163731|nr:DUF3037 domain-containing protein [uncultured Cytophaga sp.]